jgi:hypothetical protein
MLSTSERGQFQPCEACIKPHIKTMNQKLHEQLKNEHPEDPKLSNKCSIAINPRKMEKTDTIHKRLKTIQDKHKK